MRASRSGGEGRRKNFPVEGEDNHLRSVCRPDPPSLAAWPGLLFGAKKAKKWGNPIRFLPPPSALFSSLRFLPVALSSFVSLLYGQIRLPAVGIITEWERRRRLLHLTFAFSVLCLNELKRRAVDLPPAPRSVPMNVTSAAI